MWVLKVDWCWGGGSGDGGKLGGRVSLDFWSKGFVGAVQNGPKNEKM